MVSAVGTLAIGGLVASGCGSNSSSSAKPSTGSETTSAATKGGEICVSSLVGFAIVPDLLQIWKDTATKNGMTVKTAIADPEGDLNAASANVKSCVRNKAKVTVNITTPDKTQAASIKQTMGAGNFYIGQYAGDPVPGQTMSIGPDDAGMSKQLFDYAKAHIANTGKPPVVLTETTSAFPVVVARVGSFTKLAKAAGWKVVGPVELPADKVATTATSKTASELRSNPDINIVLSYTDDVTAGASPAIKDSGKDVKILAYEGLETTYAGMRAGNSLVAAVAAAPIDIYNDLQVWSVRNMLSGKFQPDTIARCIGPLITPDNVPAKGEPNKGGSCLVGTTTYSAEQLKAMAQAS
jgi:ABC-type sugar transport system substrate-binding protein